jgi:hypothetical protein
MDLQSRPGANLLRLLARKRRDFAEFATSVEMASDETHAAKNLRRYTHAAAPKWPTAAMIERWAAELDVDPLEFYRPAARK